MSNIGALQLLRPARQLGVELSDVENKGYFPHVENAKEHINNVVSLLSADPSVRIQNSSKAVDSQELGKPTGPTGAPCIDNVDDPKAKEADLAKLIAYLKLEGDQLLAELSKRRIEISSTELEKRHGEQKAQLEESIKQMDKATKMGLANKIITCIAAAIAVAFAVATSIATFGATSGASVAAIVGLVASITAATTSVALAALTCTDVTQKWTEAMAKSLLKTNKNLDEKAANIIASVIVALISIAATVGPGTVSMVAFKAAAKTAQITAAAEATAQMIAEASALSAETGVQIGAGVGQAGAQVGQAGALASNALSLSMFQLNFISKLTYGAIGAANLGMQAGTTYVNYESGMSKVETTLIEQFLAVLRQHLDESQEDLEELMTLIQGDLKAIIDILSSKTDVELEMSQKMGHMV